MKKALVLTIAFLTLSLYAQEEYPPIRENQNQLKHKQEYLEGIKNTTGQKHSPNVVMILADDLGKNDISVYDLHGVSTPNLDRMAGEGVRFMEAYSTCPVCSPSRASALTGRYQQRYGYERQPMQRYARKPIEFFFFKHFVNVLPMHIREPWYSPPDSEIRKQGLPESETSLFEIFKAAGYKTACIGKWHLGYNEPFLPQNKGIDDFYGFYEAFSLYSPLNRKDIINVKHNSFHNRHIWRQKRKGPSAIIRNGKEIMEPGYLTTRIAEEACGFIDNNADKPFLLYVPFSAPHTPFQAPEEYVRRFDYLGDINKQVYFAMITLLDEAIGMIGNCLEENGLEERTLVIFASDNGGATYTGATDNGELNGGKFTQFEGGINIPMIIKWNGILPAGTDFNQPVTLMDIFSTSLAVTGIEQPSYIDIDGVDLIPFLKGENPAGTHDAIYWRTDYNKAVRKGRWKLLVNTVTGVVELYDLESDRGETTDMSKQEPETVRELLEALAKWEKDLLPPSWPGVMEIEFEINGKPTRWAI